MKAPQNHATRRRLWLATALTAALLGGCASGPGTTVVTPLDTELASLTQLAGAEQASQLALQLGALNRSGQFELALALSQRVPVDAALGPLYQQVERQATAAMIGVGDYNGALARIERASQAPDQLEWLGLETQAYDGLGDQRAAMAALARLIELTPDDANGRLLGDIWVRAQLASLLDAGGDDAVSGWLALAQAAEAGAGDVRAWRKAWPDHRANRVLPADIQALLARGWAKPARIGVILPLSGPLVGVGSNLLDGIMSEQLSDRSTTVIVSDGSLGVEAAVAELTAQSVDLIVGPLPKDQVNQLLAMAIDLPLLTLNYSDIEADALAPRAQMGLAPEDAARDAARLMMLDLDDPRRPIVLVPGDATGERVSAAYISEWTDNGGVAPVIAPYLNDNQRQVVADAIGIAASQARHSALQRLLAADLEFTPRRRADISSVYIYANAVTAAQLKPLLAFYYAGDLPVWVADAALDRDLDLVRDDLVGANLVAMPWQLDSLADSNVLFELGRDAWLLANSLDSLAQGNAFDGRTGLWTLESERLTRAMSPARLTAEGFTALERPPERAEPLATGLPANSAPPLEL
ncbi:hypothetical protein GH975_10390 [Litorivicinus lipolyticus]|uniref:Penicillin-binding protein activator n=1 Tax=Litorivicinus lipolyticus TaxID=418701 RepID=A0A5Q2QIR0_9GAMM|nr:hypothetical protein GH975_10390 [Litorivicinus lipolyticus]